MSPTLATTTRVVVVGGGLAGLSAACELATRGLPVTVLEGRNRFGGATFSFTREGMKVDNGQHVLLRCYDHYRAFVERIGTATAIGLQRRFTMPLRNGSGTSTALRRTGGPAPFHLLAGLAGYDLLAVTDRLRVAVGALAMRRLDPSDPGLDRISFGSWLRQHGQNTATITGLWNLFTVAALNADADDASLALAAKVFRTGLLDRADAADIGIPLLPLDELHVQPALDYLTAYGAQTHHNTPVRGITSCDSGYVVELDETELYADAVVVATPPETAVKLCPATAQLQPQRLRELGAAPIVNVHVVFERPVMDTTFVAVVGSPVQFVFDRTGPSGISVGQYLTVSVSAAQQWIDVPTARVRAVFLTELTRLFPAAASTSVRDFFVTRERRATFHQTPGTRRLRPPTVTALPRLVLAGAWTDTGWPDTMEGAVRSGNDAAAAVADQLTRREDTREVVR